MGFCHEFTFKNKHEVFDEQVLKQIKKILHIFHNKGIIAYEKDIQQEPEMSEKCIRFNGSTEQYAYETFYFTPDCTQYNFLKTGGWSAKPEYDFITICVLCLLKKHYGEEFILVSDAFYCQSNDPDLVRWYQALKYLNKIFKDKKIRIQDVRPSSKELLRDAVEELKTRFTTPA